MKGKDAERTDYCNSVLGHTVNNCMTVIKKLMGRYQKLDILLL